MYNNVLNRKMFQMGGPVMADPSMGTPMQPPPMQPPPMQPPPMQNQGIMTGLEDSETETALTSVAQDLQQVMTEIDGAENYEGIMNALRGDQATIEQRRTELAQYVGDADSVKTPESVLALAQPTLEILKVTEQAETDQTGGIASLGEPPVNFNQASFTQSPGLDEASMRIGQGEQFVQRALGTGPNGEVIGLGGNRNPFEFNNYSFLNKNGIIDPEIAVNERIKSDFEKQKNFRVAQLEAPRTFKENLDLAKKAGLYTGNARTTEEILQGYKDTFGDDTNYKDLQNSLNLVDASSGLMQDTRPFAEALGGAFGKFAEGASKNAREYRKEDRALELAALTASEAELKADIASKNAANLSVYEDTIDAEIVHTKNLVDIDTEVYKEISEQVKTDTINQNKRHMQRAAAKDTMAGKAPLTYMAEINGKQTVFGVRHTSEYTNGTHAKAGLAMVDTATNTLVPLPEGAVQITDAQLTAWGKTQNPTDFTPVKMTMPVVDKDGNPTFKNITGFYSPTAAQHFYRPDVLLNDGTTIQGDIAKVPANMVIGYHAQDFNKQEQDGSGRTKVTTTDPFDGSTRTFNTHTELEDGTTIVDTLSAYRATPLKVGQNARGQIVTTGTPYVEESDRPPIVSMLRGASPDQVANAQVALSNLENFMISSTDFMRDSPGGGFSNLVGFGSGFKGILGSTLGVAASAFDLEWGTWEGQETSRAAIRNIKREWIQSRSLSDKYPIVEQAKLASQVFGSDEEEVQLWWKTDRMSAAQFKELMRVAENSKQGLISFMTGQPAMFTRRAPSGQPSEPYRMDNLSDRTTIMQQVNTHNESNDPETKQKIKKLLNRTFIRLPRQAAQQKLNRANAEGTQEEIKAAQNELEKFGNREIFRVIPFRELKGLLK